MSLKICLMTSIYCYISKIQSKLWVNSFCADWLSSRSSRRLLLLLLLLSCVNGECSRKIMSASWTLSSWFSTISSSRFGNAMFYFWYNSPFRMYQIVMIYFNYFSQWTTTKLVIEQFFLIIFFLCFTLHSCSSPKIFSKVHDLLGSTRLEWTTDVSASDDGKSGTMIKVSKIVNDDDLILKWKTGTKMS